MHKKEKRKMKPTKSMENVFVHVKTNHDEFPFLFVVCVCEKNYALQLR